MRENLMRGATALAVSVILATGGWVVKLSADVTALEKEIAVDAVRYVQIQKDLDELKLDVKTILNNQRND